MVKWIKITTDIFNDEKIKIIDTMPARDEVLVIWFKLLTLAGKTNQSGMLFMNNRIAYTLEMLAAIFNRELSTVKLAISTFESFGMIEVEENQVITISNWEKHQNIDGLEKIRIQTNNRVKKHRENQKKLLSNDCNVTETLSLTEGNATEEEKNKNKNRKDNNELTPEESTQSKVEYSKVKESKEEVKNLIPSTKWSAEDMEYKLSLYLYNYMLKNNPSAKKPNLQKWSDVIDKMIRLDNREPDHIKKVIEFCQKDEFWLSNILSTSKLRDKYDALVLKMKKNNPQSNFNDEFKENLQNGPLAKFLNGGD